MLNWRVTTRGFLKPGGLGRRSIQAVTPLQLVLRIGDHQTKKLTVPVAERLLIGRAGLVGQDQPHVDLTSFGAVDHGVSRLHAALHYEAGQLLVEDLGSTNGTRLNGLLIPPQTPYVLRNGDELELGDLRVAVRLVRGKDD